MRFVLLKIWVESRNKNAATNNSKSFSMEATTRVGGGGADILAKTDAPTTSYKS